MNKTLFKIGLGVLALAGIVWPSRGAVTGMKTLHGHVPAVVAHLASSGRVNGTNVLHLAIGLPLHNQDQLTALEQQVSDPSSPNYRQYLTPEQFTAKFGPTEDDAQAIIRFAQSNGFTVKKVHSNRMLVEVDARAADVEHAFNVTLHNYHLAAENRDFYAPDQEPTVSADLPVLDVQGLNSYVKPHPRLHTASIKAKGSRVGTGSGIGGTFLGNDFRPAYVPGTTLTGAGQSVALFEYDGYISNDITLYENLSGLPAVSLTNVLLQGFSGFPTPFGGQTEVTLDIDMVIAMAPGVNQIQVYEGNLEVAYLPNLVLNRIAMDNSARQISCSWGWPGGPSATTDQIFQQMILQGQTFFDASGDVCAFLPPGQPGSVDDPTLPNAPSDDPYITQVGATTLTTTGPGGSFVSESVWNWGNEFPGQGFDGVGSSGGISGYYTIPTWQQGINMTTNLGSTTMRNLPDVAMPGDNIDLVVNGVDIASQGGFEGGTSCAAPLWAGFIALVNQQAAASGLGSIGFLNPAIYALAKTNATVFNDVVRGNNTWSQSPTEFFAVPGFDLCAGWGSPNGINLINALTSGAVLAPTAVIPAPKQSWGNTLSVMNGANPNGLWFLFMQDDTMNNYSGTNYNGWAVNLTTANPVGFPADNQLSISATNILVQPGGQWTTTLTVMNYGPSFSTNVFISDKLPLSPAVVLVSSNSSIASSSVDIVGDTLTWNVGNLAVNAGGTLSLTFKANSTGIYTNGATVFATSDPNPDDDSVGVAITVAVATPPVIASSFLLSSGKALQLSITNDPGATIVIQASTNLVNWIPVSTNVAPFTFTNFDSTNFQNRFYRAVTTP